MRGVMYCACNSALYLLYTDTINVTTTGTTSSVESKLDITQIDFFHTTTHIQTPNTPFSHSMQVI